MPYWGAALWLLLAGPPLRHAFEASMSLHMLVQLPLLALAGAWLGAALPARLTQALGRWNQQGISGLLLASFTAMVWMLPRSMDAALQLPLAELAKFVSVPVFIGMTLGLSWPRAGFVVRGVFLVEAIATSLRVGWLYEVAPERLCTNYLVGDQQTLGWLLLAIGASASLLLVGKLVWGRIEVEPAA